MFIIFIRVANYLPVESFIYKVTFRDLTSFIRLMTNALRFCYSLLLKLFFNINKNGYYYLLIRLELLVLLRELILLNLLLVLNRT